MSLKDRFARPGPGIPKDAPRKKGLARFWEIVRRDIGSLMLCGIVSTAGFLPLLIGILAAISASNGILMIAAGLVGGAVAGPFLCALYDAILRMLRDEPAFWWHTYKKALRQDWRASLLPGALLGLVVSALLFMSMTSAASVTTAFLAGLVSLLITSMIVPLWFAQIALMDLPFVTILKNSLIMAFAYAPRTLPAALVQAVYWGLMVFLLPWSMLVLPVFGLWLVSLVCLQILYIPLDKTFEIEKRINEKRENALSAPPEEE